MLTNEEAMTLIGLSKKVLKEEQVVDHVTLGLVNGKARYFLHAEEEPDYLFLLGIYRSAKNHLKITMHFQEDNARIGLLRVDYNGQHKNPSVIKSDLPSRFEPYAGQWFGYDKPHIHYYVEGYKQLAWAIPLADDDFPVKSIDDEHNILPATRAFAQKINLKTEFKDYQDELAI